MKCLRLFITECDMLSQAFFVWDYAEIELRDNALHAQPLRKLTSEIWKTIYLPHNQHVRTEVWQNWLTAVHQATKSTDNQ